MANVRNLRREASTLLRLAKRAFKLIRDNDVGPSEDRTVLLQEMRECIDRADPPDFDDSASSVNLTMTNATADALVLIMKECAAESEEHNDAYQAVLEGLERTKQRTYLRLDLNHVILKRVHFAVRYKGKRQQEKAFKRLAKEIETLGLNKNPMEILGRMGL
jgi:hypothetical protein